MDKYNQFTFSGHTFSGVRVFTKNEDFKTITHNQFQVVRITGPKKWDREQFYKQAKLADGQDFDIFLMDDKFPVLPCHNNLFVYGKKSSDLYDEYQKRQERISSLHIRYDRLKDEMLQYLKELLTEKKVIEMPQDCFVPYVHEVDNGYITNSIVKISRFGGTIFDRGAVLLIIETTENEFMVDAKTLDAGTLHKIMEVLD